MDQKKVKTESRVVDYIGLLLDVLHNSGKVDRTPEGQAAREIVEARLKATVQLTPEVQ